MTGSTRRRAAAMAHRGRPIAGAEREETMESYRQQILTMLDSIQDARLMRLVYEVVKAILMNR